MCVFNFCAFSFKFRMSANLIQIIILNFLKFSITYLKKKRELDSFLKKFKKTKIIIISKDKMLVAKKEVRGGGKADNRNRSLTLILH